MTSFDDSPAFAGLKVLDLSQGVAGPHCGMLLARHGAEVIKLEPLDGDWGRAIGRQFGDHCPYSLAFNQGKKSLALDLKADEGREIAFKLASEADVILQNYRPGVIDRLGLGYAAVSKENPAVVYLSLSGFGPTGPNANFPATDSVMQAFSGLMSINRDSEGVPQRIGILAIDIMTGLYAFQAVAPALYRHAATGQGVHIETSLMEAVGAFQAAKMIEFTLEAGRSPTLGVPVAMFETQDGYLNINGRRDSHFAAICDILGVSELATDPRFETVMARIENETELMPQLREAAKRWTARDLADALNAADVLNAPVHTYGDYFAAPQVQALDAVRWISHEALGELPIPTLPGFGPARAGDPRLHVPGIGENGSEILQTLGYSKSEIDQLQEQTVIHLGTPALANA